MTFRVTPLTQAMNRREYAEAAASLTDAISLRAGNLSAAARDIDVDYRTLTRWLVVLKAEGHDVRASAKERPVRVRGGGSARPKAVPVQAAQAQPSNLMGKSKDEQRLLILAAAREAGGNVAKVARAFGVTKQAMYKRVESLGIAQDIALAKHPPAA